MTAGFSARLASYVAEGDRPLPAHAVEAARELFLDTLGVAFAGSREPAAVRTTAVVDHEGGAARAIVIGTRRRASATGAALANGTAAHALDLDDSHHPGFLHPSAVLVPAVLALGEDREADGASVVAAYLYGLDTVAAIGSAINIGHYELGWHATATIGTIAAAVAASRLLELPAERTEAATAIAASRAGGVRRNFGSMTKPLHAGLAAADGIRAALLAEAGMTAGDAVLEGDLGFFDLVAGPGRWDAEAGLRVLDGGFALAIEGLGIKRFASCGVTHAPIEAALRLREEHGVRPEEIEELEVVVNPLARQIAAHDAPSTGLTAKFSLQHCLAVALLDGAAGLPQFTDARTADERVTTLRDRARVTTDPAIGLAGHMSFGCRLRARLTGGRELWVEVEMARGKWIGERLTHREVVEKYESCMAAAGVATPAAAACCELVERLDSLPSVTELSRAVEAAAPTR